MRKLAAYKTDGSLFGFGRGETAHSDRSDNSVCTKRDFLNSWLTSLGKCEHSITGGQFHWTASFHPDPSVLANSLPRAQVLSPSGKSRGRVISKFPKAHFLKKLAAANLDSPSGKSRGRSISIFPKDSFFEETCCCYSWYLPCLMYTMLRWWWVLSLEELQHHVQRSLMHEWMIIWNTTTTYTAVSNYMYR